MGRLTQWQFPAIAPSIETETQLQLRTEPAPRKKHRSIFMAVASGGARGAVAPPVKKPPLKNNRNQNTYLNILGVLGMESYDFR